MDSINIKNTAIQVFIWSGLWALITWLISFDMPSRFNSFDRIWHAMAIIGITIIINLNFLLPKFYFKKKVLLYLVGCFLVFLFLFLLNYLDLLPKISDARVNGMHDRFLPEDVINRFGDNFSKPKFNRFRTHFMILPPFVLSLFGSTVIELSKFATQKELEASKLLSENALTELKFLKAQINPHFLFNALNNIYALTLTQNKNAPKNLLKLSNMLRYMVYDCAAQKVLLSKEIDYLKNYVSLINLKDSGGLNIKMNLEKIDSDALIPPLLFIPFVENAFKHSKFEDLKNGWVNIILIVKDKKLDLKVSNSVFNDLFTKDKVGGIGLSNVRKRLDLLYKEDYNLDINKDQNTFKVHLTISNI